MIETVRLRGVALDLHRRGNPETSLLEAQPHRAGPTKQVDDC